MCVSYDKSLREPFLLVQQLCQFLGVCLSEEALEDVVTFVRPNRLSGNIHREGLRRKDREYYDRMRRAG